MKRIISLFSLFILLFVNILTPVSYAMDGEDYSSESVSESVDTSADADASDAGESSESDVESSDDSGSDESVAEDSEADISDDNESLNGDDADISEGNEESEETSEDVEDNSGSIVSNSEETELVCKQEGAPENAHYISTDGDLADENCKWECDNQYLLSEDGLSCILNEETDSKGNNEEVKSCEIPENAVKVEGDNLLEEDCKWECSQGYLISEDKNTCEEINFSKYRNEPSVAALCQRLGLDWEVEKGDLAKLAGIEDYAGTREQNESIRLYLVDHVEDILKGKFNVQEEVVEKNKGFVYSSDIVLNSEEIKGESIYNNITVNVLAPIGSFPEGTTLKINPITKKKELKEIENQIIDQQDDIDETLELLAFDISFFYDEKEVQPVEGKTVQVTFDYAENKKLSDADTNEEQELKVYHLDDKDANGNKVEEIEVKEVVINENESEEGKVVVDANGFSVYVIIKVNTTADTVTITYDANGGTFGNSTTKEVSYNKNGNVFEIASFPGAPYRNSTDISVQSGWMFVGWYTEPEATTEWLGQASDTTGNMIVYAKWLPFNDIEIKGATIMDRNLGATTTGAGPNAPKDSYGYYFQWGNNHGFVKNSNNSNIKNSNTVSTQKDVTGYGPDKYYYSTDISNQLKWTETQGSQNLWGNDGTELERQGPCPKGYHIPKRSERYTVIGTDVSVLPMAGYMHYNGGGSNQQPYISSSHYAYLLSTSQGAGYGTWSYDGNNKQDNRGNGYGGNIRCFKNTTPLPEIPEVEEENTTWEKNSETVMPEEGTTITFDDEEGLSGAALTGVKLNVESHTGTNDITITPLDLGVTTIDEILGEVELKFNKTDNSLINKTAKFNKAVKVKIPVRNGINGKVKVRIKHGTNPFGFTGLALSEVECNDNGTPKTNPYNGGLLNAPTNGFVEIYTCSASTLAVTDVAAFAAIGDNGYETLAEAIAAVPTDGTQTEIVLLKDGTINETLAFNGNKNILLNLSGHTLNNNGFTYILNGRLEVKDGILGTRVNVYGYEDSSMTSYLKVDDDAILEGDYPIILREYNGGDKAYGAIIDVQGNINATNTALWVMGNIKQGDSVIDIHGILTGTNVGVAQNGYSTVNVHTGASIYAATETAFEQRAGITNIYGGTLKSDGTPESEEANNNGTTTVGAAFAVSPYNLSNQTINIEGGTFEAINALLVTNKTSSATALEDNVQIEVKGGNYIGNVVSKNPLNAENPLEDFISGGSFNHPVADNLCAEGYYPQDNGNGTYGVLFGIAKIGATIYGSLEEAIEAAAVGTAESPTVIEILEDFDFTTINTGKYIKLDLGGQEINGGLDLYEGFVTIANGTLKREGKTVVWVETSRANVENYNKLTVASNATLKGDYTIILNSEDPDKSKGYGANVEIKGNVEGTTAALWVMGNIINGNSLVDVYGTLTGQDVGIAQNGYSTVNVYEGASIYAKNETAFEQRAGTTNIYGGTLKSDGNPASEEANNNGTTTVGAAFAVSPYNLSNQEIHIEGGAFDAINALIITNETSSASALKDRITIDVEGGSFKGNVVSNNPVAGGNPIENFIEGGTFTKRPAIEYCADGLIPTQNPNGTYGVKLGWKVIFKDVNERYVWQVVDGERISAATVTPEEGYIFDGWYESGATTSFNFNNPITRDVNLEAVWKVNVTFNSNGGTSVPTQTIKQGGTVTQPTNPERSGFTFNNWTKGDIAWAFDSIVTEPITLNANWNVISGGTAYTVIHQTRNENSLTYTQRDTIQEYGDAGTAVDPEKIYKPNYEGYVFDRCDPTNIAGESTTVVRCYYEFLNHNVKFFDDEGIEYTGLATLVANYGKIQKPKNPTKTNDAEHSYTFNGWYETGVDTAYDFNTIQTGTTEKTINLYAKFDSLNKYTVSFYNEDGITSLDTQSVDAGSTVSYGGVVPTKEATTQTGYTFTGWYLSGDDNKTKVDLSEAINGNVIYIALFDEYVQEYTVTYEYSNDVYGASTLPTQEKHKYGEPVLVANQATAPGQNFTGWFMDGEIVSNTFTMPDHDVKLTGEFYGTYVDFVIQDLLEKTNGNGFDDGEIETGKWVAMTEFQPTTEHTYQGYELSGSLNDYKQTIAGNGSSIIYVVYKRSSFNVKYVYENAPTKTPSIPVELPNDAQYKYMATVTVTGDVEVPGYDFEWSKIPNSTFQMPAEDVVITGTFTPRDDTQYEVRYYFEKEDLAGYTKDDSLTKILTGVTDETVQADIIDFDGFTLNSSATNSKLSGRIKGDGKLVLKLYYDRNSYPLHFNPKGGTGTDLGDQMIAYNTTGVRPANPQKTGYVFSNWYSDEEYTSIFDFEETAITGETTIYANWTPATGTQYIIREYKENQDGSFSQRGGDIIKTGETDSVAEAPINDYTGLEFDEDNENNVLSGNIEADGLLVLEVYYKRSVYTISFDSDEGTEVDALTGKYNYTLTVPDVPADPQKTGWTFAGWYKSGDTTMTTVTLAGHQIKSDLDLVAKWTANSDTPYKYHYELENLDGTGWDFIAGPTDLSGTTGQPITIAEDLENLFTGFTLSGTKSDYTSNIINADGLTDVAIYYTRNSHDVKYVYENSGSLTSIPSALPETKSYKYGESVTIADAATATGYTFSWNTGNFTMPDEDVIITGTFASGTAEYTVSYYYQDANGEYSVASGSAVRTGTTDTIATVTDEDKISKDSSYTFVESGSNLSGYINGDGSLELKVLFKGVYTITYQAGVEGNFTDKVYSGYEYGTNTPILPIPLDEFNHTPGYMFDGWSPEWNPTVTGNVTYVAQWVPIQTEYQVEHYQENLSGDFELVKTETFTGATNTLVEGTGINYTGFTLSGDIEGSILTGNIKGNGSLVLKLFYTRNEHTVNYGSSYADPASTKLKYGEDIVYPTMSRTGHEVIEWNNVPEDGKMPDSDLDLYPTWSTGSYTISFSGANLDPITGEYGLEVTAPADPEKDGYTFVGWDTTIPETMPAEDTTITAQWTPVEYSIAYELNSGIVETTNPATYTIETDDITLVNPTKDGYTFQGWSGTKLSGSENTSVSVAKGSTGNRAYEANWTAIEYTVTFNENGGDAVEDLTYTIESGLDSLPTPTRDGYEFTGWYDENNNEVTAIARGSTGDVSLTAHWEAVVANYTVKHYREAWEGFNKNGKTASQASDGKWYYEYVSQPFTGLVNNNTGPVTPNKYDGFIYDESAPNITSGTITTEGLELKLYYARKLFTVSFDSNGGSAVTGQEVGYALTGIQPADPVRTGYQFVGWNDKDGNPYDFENNDVRKNTKLTAEWTPNNYLVNFDSNGASGNIGSIATQYDTEITLSTGSELSKTGHNFMGWSTTSTGDVEYAGGEAVSGLVDTGSITLYAVWTPEVYDITFIDEDGTTVLGVFSGAYGEDPTSFWTEDPTQSSANWKCQFKGWSPTPAAITGEATYKATFYSLDDNNPDLCSLASYTVTWKNDDGTEIKSDGHIGFGSTPSYSGAVPQKTGDEQYSYIFSGWTPAITKVTGDVEYTAEYTAVLNKYDVTWNNWDGTEIKVDTGIDYGTTLEFSGEVPQRTGDNIYSYVFSGWTPSVHAITGDTVYQAEFKSTFTPYTITWSGNNDNNLTNTEVSQIWESYVNVQPDPERTGYVFAGWSPEVISGVTTVEGDVTYVAQWTPANDTEYTVEHYQENLAGTGFDLIATETLTGTTESTTNAVAKDYTGFTLSGSIEQQTISATGATVVRVEYSRNTYELTYFGQFAQPKKQQVKYGAEIPAPESTNRTGYVFSGFTNEPEDGKMPAEDIEVKINWAAAEDTEYTVEHYQENLAGTGFDLVDTEILTGTTKKKTNAVAKDYTGFTLSGSIKQQTISATGATVVRIEYSRNTYELTYFGQFAQPKTQQVKYGAEIPAPESTNRTGYVFRGFKEGAPEDGKMPAENIEVKIEWKKSSNIPYIVEHYQENLAGTGFDLSDTDNLKGTVGSGTEAVAKNYTGFELSGDIVQETIEADGSTVVKVEYKRVSYPIVFNNNGGTGDMENQMYKYQENQALTGNTFVRTGYQFLGWNTESDGSGSGYDNEEVYQMNSTTGLNLYAQWKINQYTITFDTSSGTEIAPITGDYGIVIETPTNPTRTGYVFGGWDKEIPETMPAEDITITAKWLSTEWNLEALDSPHGEGTGGKGYDTVVSGNTITFSNVALRIPDDDVERPIDSTWIGVRFIAPEADLTGNSTIRTWGMEGKENDGRYYLNLWLSVSTGKVEAALASGTNIEWTFTGAWNGTDIETFKVVVDPTNIILKDKEQNTNIEVESGSVVDKNEYYDVTFDTNGGSSVTGQNVHYNSGVVIPTAPEKTGYQFSGWTLNGETFDFTGTKITGDITLTGAWTPVTYDIDYLPNGGVIKSGNATTYTIEDEVQLYNTAIRTGYVFKGWLDASSGVVDRIEKGTYGNQILLAQWQQVSAALAEAKSGDKHPVVSSDVTVDVDAAPGTAEYTGNIPTGTPSFDTPLLTNVVNSGTIEEYSLVGIERSSTQLDVKTDELQAKTGYVATIVGGLEVYLKKITITKNASGVIETKTEKNTNTVNFSKPVALPIHITTSATGVKVMVNHGEGYGLSGLSINPNTTCTNGIASDPYTGELIPVENSYAWIYTCSASKFVAYTETVKSSGGGSSGGSSSGGSGGGGGGSSKSSSSSSSSSTTPTTNTGNTTNIDLKGVVSAPNKDCLNITEESKIKYSDEVLDAYAWAYANGVVTSNDVEKARVYSYITRAELAKIMVQYVAGVLKKKPVVEGNVSYADVDESLGEYAGYINLAYQYQIMGINADGTPLKEFGPKSLVTRAEFASVLSRVLYGDKYNVDGSAFYSMHIDVLNQLGIIKDTNPAILEKIGWILIMLKRASKDIPNTKDASNVEYCPITSEDEQKAAYEWALKYGITSIDDPDKARLGEELTRAEFAKMMVQYMINVLHKKPILNEDISYPDVDGSLGDLEAYIKLAYQYQIMGIHGNGQPLEEFAPNRIVTRKEFATVFSRILFGDRFNIDGPEYWTNHIDALKEISVLKDGNPALQEVRGRVMLMMYRSADDLNK